MPERARRHSITPTVTRRPIDLCVEQVAMKDRLFLFHWHAAEAEQLAAPLRAQGWQVDVEAQDGARGSSAVKATLPDAVVIYLRRLPSHGRETAEALRSSKATRAVPIIFVDGEGE